MFDETISLLSIWTSMNSWLTPTILFLFLNLMIGTIFISSTFNSPKTHNQHQQPPQPQPQPQLSRVPSVLQRLKSINFYSYYSQTHLPESDPIPNAFPDPQHERKSSRGEPMVRTAKFMHESGPLPQVPHNKNKAPAIQVDQSAKFMHESEPLPTVPHSKTKVPAIQAVQSAKFMHESEPPPTVPHSKTRVPAIQAEQSAKFMHESGPRPQTTQTKTRAPAIQEDSTDDEGPTLDEIYSRIKGISSSGHHRQSSDTLPMSGNIPVKLPAKMKKSASDESAFNHFEAEYEASPSIEEMEITAAVIAAAGGNGAEVDARADDFINRFKKQLQLQRIESIVRYKDMITRGSAQ